MKELFFRLEDIGGCGDGGCMIHVRPGMHTNGGCRCSTDPLKMRQTVHAYKGAVAALTAENERLRGALGFMLEAYSGPEIRMCCDGRECPCMGVTNYQEADRYALAALQPKEAE